MSDQLSLQEQVLLLCLNDETGKLESDWIELAIHGAALLDLLLRGRLGLDDEQRVSVADPSPTGDELLDGVLARIAQDEPRDIRDWAFCAFTRGHRQALLDRLIARGILRREDVRVLWVFPAERYPAQDSKPEQDVRARIREAIEGDGLVDPEVALVIDLLKDSDAIERVLTDRDAQRFARRIEAICSGEAVARSDEKAVHDALCWATTTMSR